MIGGARLRHNRAGAKDEPKGQGRHNCAKTPWPAGSGRMCAFHGYHSLAPASVPLVSVEPSFVEAFFGQRGGSPQRNPMGPSCHVRLSKPLGQPRKDRAADAELRRADANAGPVADLINGVADVQNIKT
jgi:hypothetical protein